MSQMRRVSSVSSLKLLNYPMLAQLSQASTQSQQSQQDGVNQKKTVMYFVIPPGETEEQAMERSVGEMYQTAEAHFLIVEWIKDEDCQNVVLEDNGNVFVFDDFDSPGFKYWEKNAGSSPFQVEILGPQVLRYIFTSKDVIKFTTRAVPTFTLAMRDMIISLSGFKDKKVKDDIENKVRWMNGTVSASLTHAVTHVITTTALTDKSLEAQKQKNPIPLMNVDWVKNVWKDNHTASIDASDKRYVKYSCPMFYNIRLCMSQISVTKKNTLKLAVEERGGKCSPDMIKGKTDLLVVTSSEGDKYKYAQRWKIPCVSPQWIETSVDQGRLLSPSGFKITDLEDLAVAAPNKLFSSTPAHTMREADFDFNNTRVSAIQETTRMNLNFNMTAETTNNFTHIDDTIASRDGKESLEKRLSEVKNSGYLDGLKIFVVDVDKYFELRRVANRSGATRLNQLTDGVTHVIVPGTKLPKAIKEKMQEMDPIPVAVTVEYILASATLGYPADDEQFKFNEEDSFHFLPPQNVSFGPARVSGVSVGAPAQNSRLSGSRVEERVSESNILEAAIGGGDFDNHLDSMPGNTPSRTGTATATTSANADDEDTDDDMTQDPTDNRTGSRTTTTNTEATNTNTNTNTMDEESSPGILVGFTFFIGIPDKTEYKSVRQLIRDHGGEVTKEHADVAILLPVCKSSDMDRADKICTKDWLVDCLTKNTLDPDREFYHLPRAKFSNMDSILKGVVCAISQYPASGRAYLIELAQAMGAKHQDVFCRKATAKAIQSTHLICKSMGSDKARAAKRWNVPVVVGDWVIDCFNEKKKVSEANYDPAHQTSTSEDHTVFMETPQRRNTMRRRLDNNASVASRNEYPPSTTKGGAKTKTKSRKKSNEVELEEVEPPQKPESPKPGTSRNARIENDFRTPPARAPSAVNEAVVDLEAEVNVDMNLDLGTCPEQEEIDRMNAEFKAKFPYTDESYEELMNNLRENGVDLETVSPMNSFEDRRLCDPNPDSPLILGLNRHASRALKEQVEIALNRSPVPTLKLKPMVMTPLGMMVKKFNELQKVKPKPRTDAEGEASKSGGNQRQVSAGNKQTAVVGANEEVIEVQLNVERLSTRLEPGTKRPSGSPEENGGNPTKRARNQSKGEEAGEREESPVPDPADGATNVSPNENINPDDDDDRSSSSTRQRNQALTKLLAQNRNRSQSPTQRRSGEVPSPIIVPVEDDTQGDVEQPHLSWNDDDANKKSTVKRKDKVSRLKKKSSRVPTPEPDEEEEDVPVPVEKQKKSTRPRKQPSEAGSTVSTTRTRRTRSQSKTRKEDAPYGHQPINNEENSSKKGKKKKAIFPQSLPENPGFMLSSLSADEKARAEAIIIKLGGRVSLLSYFDSDCSALITGSFIRSEKVMGCMAKGTFILRMEYLVKSEKKGEFLPINENFIWNEENTENEKQKGLAKIAFNWLKVILEDSKKKPMSGMKFFFHESNGKSNPAYLRLVAAAGGRLAATMEEATVVCAEVPLEVPEGVKLEKPTYLNNLIWNDPLKDQE